MLSDVDIKEFLEKGKISIDPLMKDAIQPASVDLRLNNEFLVFKHTEHAYIDVEQPIDDIMEKVMITEERPFVLHPNEFALGLTYETIGVDAGTVARLEGKSSLGRLGIIVHATAGYIDPGNKLKITLELHNIGNLPVMLRYKMPIAQVAFDELRTPTENPYGSSGLNSKYYGAQSVLGSQMYKNFKGEEAKYEPTNKEEK